MASFLEKLKRIWNSLKKSPTFFGAIFYGWLCLLGMLYAHSFYSVFDIAIFNFAEPLDFLLVAFSKASIVLGILWGVSFTLVISAIVLGILSLLGYLLFIHKSVIIFIIWVCGWIKRGVLLADQTFVDSFRSAWDTFRESLRSAWDTLRKSLNNLKDSRNKAREQWESFFWRYLFIVSTVMFILSSIWVPRYQGKQDSHVLVNKQQGEEAAQASLGSQTDFAISPIYSELIHKLLTGRLFGEPDAQQPVRVTIRQDTVQSRTRLPTPEHTFLIGTTSSFHFFYECENAQATDQNPKAGNGSNGEGRPSPENGPEAQTDRAQEDTGLADIMIVGTRNAPKCENGQPFIIPTANIASLDFNLKNEEDLPHHVGLPDILAALNQLNETISALKFDATINMESDEIIFDTAQTAGALNQLNETIKNLQIRVALDYEPDKVAEAIADFQSSLASNTTITNLNELLVALKETIANGEASDPAPDMTAVVNAFEEILNTLNITIASLDIPGVQNHCASGWKKVTAIRPFPEGKHTLEDEKKRLKEYEEYKELNFPPGETPQRLMLVGRVDSESFSSEALQFYGPQINLAEARAKWVESKLLEEFPIAPERIIVRGENYQEANKDDNNREFDRSVEVWACWMPNGSEQAETSENSAS